MNTDANKPHIAAIILTKNEERDLPACLQSLSGVATEVYVIDSGSTDGTHQVAERYGAALLIHPFENQAKQLNWALDNISIKADWILRIDADERLSPDLVHELLRIIPDLPLEVAGIEVPRRIYFLGRKIRFGDAYPVWILRLWRKGEGCCEDRWMDECIELSNGRTIRVRGDLFHNIPKDLTEWTVKHNWYATRECLDIQANSEIEPIEKDKGFRRKIKQAVYLRLPLFYRVFVYWFYRYVFKLGFLDGKEGMIYHFLQGFWYRFLVDAKLYESSVTAQIQRQPDSSDLLRK
jgi:glycosyltransferase involved in cell wall biosynthesis